MKKLFVFLYVLSLCFGMNRAADADTALFKPIDGMDAIIVESEPDLDHADYYLTTNYGDVENRGLIQFDLSSLTDATIN
jgi:hypothetical protein